MRAKLVDVAGRRESRRHRRHRDAAISADPARDPGGGNSPRPRPGSTSSRATRKRPFRPFCRTTRRSSTTAERRAEDDRQRLAKAEAMVDTLTLARADRRPRAVLDHHQRRPGRRQRAGDHADRPAGLRTLEIEAYVLNRDIGFVRVGQEAVIKVESFPFTRYGSIKAQVVRIAKDAIPSPDASAIEGDPTRAYQRPASRAAERTQNLVFAVELSPTLRPSWSTGSRGR